MASPQPLRGTREFLEKLVIFATKTPCKLIFSCASYSNKCLDDIDTCLNCKCCVISFKAFKAQDCYLVSGCVILV